MYIYEFAVKDPEDAQAEGGLDYIAETDKTASNVFTPAQVGVAELRVALLECAIAAQRLDRFKKALFRNQSRLQAGLREDFVGESLDDLMAGMGHDDLFHGIIGATTETGEMCEALVHLLDRRRIDELNMKEEIGDVLWYLSRLVKWAGTTFLTEMKRNIAKLRARHGAGGFNKERDMNRDLDAERRTLDGEGC
jgi:NTP pyrophosphatase (non-canonical NTP hydrolase)